MKALAAIAVFVAMYAAGVVAVWMSPFRPHAWTPLLALVWAVVVSKIVVLFLAVRNGRRDP